MRWNALKWVLLGGAIVIMVIYGMEVSTSGIERIYGPIEGGQPSSIAAEPSVSSGKPAAETTGDRLTEQRIAKLEKELQEVRRLAEEQAKENGRPIDQSDNAAVNKLADGTAGLLQTVTTSGIKWVVSLFDSVTS
ncbi:hypothetical protein [Paenibacillus protaetiae]|uniref:DUF3679 domain-containing protein n=1 Tax=Paenibacillus protaetiae TaxID=2509456 RepID=A0A4P6F028_9BACL|nr:hypothetical protein [Paenibacillus protaetiae]QAY66337.1 hypothetical protein ET464_07895 [Paenibacillus protaetiae]